MTEEEIINPLSGLYNHIMSLVGQNHYTKTQSDNKYSTQASVDDLIGDLDDYITN